MFFSYTFMRAGEADAGGSGQPLRAPRANLSHIRQIRPHIRQSRPYIRQSRPHIRQSRPHVRQSRRRTPGLGRALHQRAALIRAASECGACKTVKMRCRVAGDVVWGLRVEGQARACASILALFPTLDRLPANIRQSRPDSGVGFKVQVLETL